MCIALMGGASTTTTGKAMMRGLHRAIRDMPEAELRANLLDIRDRLNAALDTATPAPVTPLPVLADASSLDLADFATGH